MKRNPLQQLEALGQSLWLDYIRRDLIASGELGRLIEEDGLRGLTSNPAIFEKAIAESHDYDGDIRSMGLAGRSAMDIYESLSQSDVRNAADAFRPLYDRTGGQDGYVSLEVNPHLAHDTRATVEEARRLWAALDRPNVLIKVPATEQGLPAIRQLLGEGINVNVTLLFGLPRYRQVAEAYLDGLEARAALGKPLDHLASVASFFVGRLDALVDPLLEKVAAQGGPLAGLAKGMRGQTAIASAKRAYQLYQEIFGGGRFRGLAARGARAQRLLWASTSTKHPEDSDIKYVEALVGPDTVDTLPLGTLNAYRDHGLPEAQLERDADGAGRTLGQLPGLGINLDKVAQQLEDEGVEKFNQPFDKLMQALAQRSPWHLARECGLSTVRAETEGKTQSGQARVSHPIYGLLPEEIEGFDSLAELAMDLRWSWSHSADEVWRQLDPALWELTYNPWAVLQTVSRDQLECMLANAAFRTRVEALVREKRQATEAPAWFQLNHPGAPLTCAAYFSMEFMLSEALPIYSGGLGNVAGDQLKTASDLGVPVVGVGLLFQQGYFRQVIDKDGSQQALFPYNDPGQLPIRPLRQANGEWLRVEIAYPGYSVWLRTWQVQVGRATLYLLDSNDLANLPAHRGITSELYGGGSELRLKQELLLGIGGWKLLEALGIKLEVCHLNEGHAAFAVLERARSFMQATGQPFDVALAVTRAGNLFTTHTAVAAGFDRFDPALIEQYLGPYAETKLGITLPELLALGRRDPGDASESFNMAYLAIRGSGAVNGVSRLHGEVSRRLFGPLFPRWPVAEVPVGHITNGVHMPSWDSAAADELWTEACGKERWRGKAENLEQGISRLSDARLWQFRMAASQPLIDYARQRLARHYAAAGASAEAIEKARHRFSPNVLTLGFARRFATYKRPNLLLHDPSRLLRLLSNPYRPVQLIIAGKAHPADMAGQALIREWIQFIRRPEARPYAIFLSDYDMLLTEHLVQGVDVWLNTPRRPWEACGTSGMKVLANGGINLSELDGWWAEAYTPEVGWALGDGQEHGDDPAWDAVEAEELYTLLEQEVIPEFYTRDKDGIPTAWVARMRKSMERLTPRFSASRTVREYTEQHYLPAAAAYRERAANKGALGRQIVDWRESLEKKWGSLSFGAMKAETRDGQHVFKVRVHLAGLKPETVRVELYAEGREGAAPLRQEMEYVRQSADAPGSGVYRGMVPASRPASDYTARIIPRHDGIAIPLENARILWQR
jgi:starch phosphorylase